MLTATGYFEHLDLNRSPITVTQKPIAAAFQKYKCPTLSISLFFLRNRHITQESTAFVTPGHWLTTALFVGRGSTI